MRRAAVYLLGLGLYVTVLWAAGGFSSWPMTRFTAELTGFFLALFVAALWMAGVFDGRRQK